MADPATFEPDWASPPGDTIADALDELAMTQADLARRTGFCRKHINSLIKGRVAITADAAFRLEAVLGEPVAFWLRREAQYQEALARRAAREAASESKAWLRELPLGWMLEQGWVEKAPGKEEQVEACLRYFGVASVLAWRDTYARPLAAYRAATGLEKRLGAVAAWLRQAELRAGQMKCAPHERQAFREALSELRALTMEGDPEIFVPRLQETCGACGVAVVFVPAPPGCPVHGATRWLTADRALLALALRTRSNDQLWFSFFHEAAHILKHGKKLLLMEGLEGLDAEQEEEADRFARDLLIPRTATRELSTLRTKAEVREMARRLGVAPGILVGRMQHEGWIPRAKLNGLKHRYRWGDGRPI